MDCHRVDRQDVISFVVSLTLITASNDAIFVPMRTTIALDDDLIAKAEAYTGLREKSSLIREALKALIERESARRLALLGATQPDLVAPPRRQPQPG